MILQLILPLSHGTLAMHLRTCIIFPKKKKTEIQYQALPSYISEFADTTSVVLPNGGTMAHIINDM